MHCPWCAEPLSVDAVACKACGRDVTVLRHVHQQLSAVAVELVGLREAIAVSSIRFLDTAAVLSSAALVVLPAQVLSHYAPQWLEGILNAFVLFVSFPLGLVLGISVRGRHLLGYVGVGMLLGVVCFVFSSVAAAIAQGAGFDFATHMRMPPLLAALLLATLLTVSGGLLGDWIEGRRRPALRREGLVVKLAARLAAKGEAPPELRAAEIERRAARLELTGAVLGLLAAAPALIAIFLEAMKGN